MHCQQTDSRHILGVERTTLPVAQRTCAGAPCVQPTAAQIASFARPRSIRGPCHCRLATPSSQRQRQPSRHSTQPPASFCGASHIPTPARLDGLLPDCFHLDLAGLCGKGPESGQQSPLFSTNPAALLRNAGSVRVHTSDCCRCEQRSAACSARGAPRRTQDAWRLVPRTSSS